MDGLDLIVGIIAAAGLAVLIQTPPDGPSKWVRGLIAWRDGGDGWRTYLTRCAKCLSVWTGLFVGAPLALAPAWAQAGVCVPCGAFLLLWCLDRVQGLRTPQRAS
jgi:hypothetical protein